jgi:large subunit ribosomal protein L6
MSRKGKLPIPMPKGVEVKINEKEIAVKGPKGSLKHALVPQIRVTQENNELHVTLVEEHSDEGNFHGLYRTLISNLVIGVSHGFETKLEMIGVGYRASVQGHALDLQVGFSHPTHVKIPDGVTVKVDKNTLISVTGADKQVVGQFAAAVRAIKPPEPYQGKGIRYEGEYVRKKAGKTAAAKK